MTDGETVLIHGAGGGVGSLAAQVAVRDDAKVIGTASDADFARLYGYGAIPIVHGDGLLDRVREAAPGGIHAALDTVGTDEAVDVSLALVADPRRIATIVAFDRAQQTGIKGLGGNPDNAGRGAMEIRDAARLRLTALVTEGSVEIPVGRSFPLTSAAEVHRQLAAGQIHGRVVLIP